MFKSFLTLCFTLFVSSTYARVIVPSLDSIHWQFRGSVFRCQLSMNYPNLGTIYFQREAGNRLTLNVHSVFVHFPSLVSYSQTASPWQELKTYPSQSVEGYSAHKMGDIQLQRQAPVNILKGMVSSKWYQINFKQNSGNLVFDFVPVNFQSAENQFARCVAGLLPKGFRELKKTTYYFSSGSSTLSDAKKSLIGDIGLYVNADPSVIAVLVDGYSDAKGNRLENLRLSRIRAEHVEESLLLAGIRPSLLQVRAHGVRALIGNPESSLNRRVVVRLVKKPAGGKGDV